MIRFRITMLLPYINTYFYLSVSIEILVLNELVLFSDMPTKQQLDKAAWQWAETTEPGDITNEHIRTAYK